MVTFHEATGGWAVVEYVDRDRDSARRGLFLVCEKLHEGSLAQCKSEDAKLKVVREWADRVGETYENILPVKNIGRRALWAEKPHWAMSDEGQTVHYVPSNQHAQDFDSM